MYKSFDNGKLTSTLVNIDLEELSFCFSLALLNHIRNGDSKTKKTPLQLTPNLEQETISSDNSFELDESFK